MYHISCIIYHVSYIIYHISCIIYHISYHIISYHPPSHLKGFFKTCSMHRSPAARWAMWILPAPRASPPPCSQAPGRRCVRWRGSSNRRAVESRWWLAQAPQQLCIFFGDQFDGLNFVEVLGRLAFEMAIWRCKDLSCYRLIWSHVFDGGCCSATWAKATTEAAGCHTWPQPSNMKSQALVDALAGMLPSDNSKAHQKHPLLKSCYLCPFLWLQATTHITQIPINPKLLMSW